MTITLQVNKLIQSLESAGELSIKERKYLELAKAYQQLAAENVRLAAENKMAVDAVTVFSNVTHDVTEIICDELGHDRVAEIVAAYNDLGNMPSTDRIVAGIKADGVEAFAAHLRANDNGASVCKMIALGADDFAKQLREGAK
ncbi:hypothetical protein [Klebsiella michiganensis]|uniref:hypothetical protein n=1 Tax=Klebsiella michiganensis TaxID=1134687 RepID=UPI00227BC989|nr:hypothetical protein [Klebsiella michiganensis]MCY3510584.1 hypothetical protein [Klebsiella michiganensis]